MFDVTMASFDGTEICELVLLSYVLLCKQMLDYIEMMF